MHNREMDTDRQDRPENDVSPFTRLRHEREEADRVYNEALTALDRAIQHAGIDRQKILHVLAARLEAGDLLRITQIRDVDFIELQIAAPRGTECCNGLVVRLAEVGEESVHVGVGPRIDGLSSAAEMHHRG